MKIRACTVRDERVVGEHDRAAGAAPDRELLAERERLAGAARRARRSRAPSAGRCRSRRDGAIAADRRGGSATAAAGTGIRAGLQLGEDGAHDPEQEQVDEREEAVLEDREQAPESTELGAYDASNRIATAAMPIEVAVGRARAPSPWCR